MHLRKHCWRMGCSLALLGLLAVSSLAAEEELPQPDAGEAFEVEPPLLVHERARDGSIANGETAGGAPANGDPAKLEAELARAEGRAAAGDRLYRAGIIAKVDAEQRALKVVQLRAALADAQLEQAKAQTENASHEQSVADAAAAAKRAADDRRTAEIEQAMRNLQRQQKLLALGSGRKADVHRAEEKLAQLQQAGD